MDYHPLTKQITELLKLFSDDENQRQSGIDTPASYRYYRIIKYELSRPNLTSRPRKQ